MARDDRLKKVQGVGADFLETARTKAEDFLKELSRAGGGTQGTLDDLVVGGRRSTEQFVASVRKEVQNQLRSLGIATKSDLDALERRLSGRTTGTAAGRTSGSTTKAAAAKKAGAAKKSGASRSTSSGTGAATARKASPAKKAAKKATTS